MVNTPLRIIQLSDIHLFSERNKALLGVKTQESYDTIVQLMHDTERGKVDAIILSGDLSQDGTANSYAYVAHKLSDFKVPIYAIPGNHDEVSMLLRCYATGPVSCEQRILFKDWLIILLNSHKPGAVEGELAPDQLRFLAQSLREATVPNIIVLFHHHPVSVGSEWIEPIGLTNKDAFWTAIAGEKRIKAVVFGHVHQEFEATHHGILCLGPPSTCIQFTPRVPNFALHNIPPGYRWLHLYPDGRLETGIKRLAEYVGEFQPDAKGY